jgi:hypothetical protein
MADRRLVAAATASTMMRRAVVIGVVFAVLMTVAVIVVVALAPLAIIAAVVIAIFISADELHAGRRDGACSKYRPCDIPNIAPAPSRAIPSSFPL